jgi:hypothetical protein
MSNDSSKLQRAIFLHLSSDPALISLLNGAKIYDRPPINAALPYVTMGMTRAFEAGTATENASEHLFALLVWSRQGGRKEVSAIMFALRKRLETLVNVFDAMRIVNLRYVSEDISYDARLSAYQGSLRLRAMTEAAVF